MLTLEVQDYLTHAAKDGLRSDGLSCMPNSMYSAGLFLRYECMNRTDEARLVRLTGNTSARGACWPQPQSRGNDSPSRLYPRPVQ